MTKVLVKKKKINQLLLIHEKFGYYKYEDKFSVCMNIKFDEAQLDS